MSLNTNPEQDAQFAAEFNADVTREQLAEVYAEAVFGACQERGGSLETFLEQYDSFVNDVLTPWPKFEEYLSSIMVPLDAKYSSLDRLLADSDPLFRNFLRILAKRGRLELLRDIYRQIHRLNDKKKGRVPVRITTATPLGESERNELIASLRSVVRGEPEITAHVDPETIGGIIVRVGDTVYDASIATQLKNVRQHMIDRSTHEIQSRRDRFRNTEGN